MSTRPIVVPREEDVRALIKSCSNRAPTGIRNRALIAVMWRCGLRVSEALDLEPRDVNLAAGELNVRHGKGDKQRLLGIDTTTVALLSRWMEHRPARARYVFVTLKGSRVSRGYVWQMLERESESAGLAQRVHPHALRHAFTDRELRAGRPMHVLRDELGHASLASTNRYARGVHNAEVIETMKAEDWEL